MAKVLKQLLIQYQTNKSKQIEGKLIQILKTNQYFHKICDKYGSQIISQYLPILEYQEVREGMPLIMNRNHIVVIDGAVKQFINGFETQVFNSGTLIQPDISERSKLIVVTHTILILIKRTKAEQTKIFNYITKKEKEITLIDQTNEKQINQNLLIRKRVTCLRSIDLFSHMGNFDIKELAIHSIIQTLTKDTITHRNGSNCNRVGFILLGKVKIVYYAEKHEKMQNISKFFMKKQSIETDGIVSSELEIGDWIGLEESFGKINYLSSGKILSQQCQILWINNDIFQKIVNETTNYEKVTKIKSLIQAKKTILNRSLIIKNQKKQQIAHYSLTKNTNAQLINKMRSLSNQPIQKSFSSKSKNSNHQKICLPSNLFHDVREDELVFTPNLPKLDNKYNFFPEEFQKAPIPFELSNELKSAKMQVIKGRVVHSFKQTSNHYTSRKNPDMIYNTIKSRINLKPDQPISKKKKKSNYFQHMKNPQKNQQIKERKRFTKSICTNLYNYDIKSEPEYKTLQIK